MERAVPLFCMDGATGRLQPHTFLGESKQPAEADKPHVPLHKILLPLLSKQILSEILTIYLAVKGYKQL